MTSEEGKLKGVFRILRPAFRTLLPSLCAVVVLKALLLMQPFLLRYLVDAAVAHRSAATIVLMGAIVGLWHLARGGADIFERVLTTRVLDRYALHLRHRLYRQLLAATPPSVSGDAAGDFLVRVTDDVTSTRVLVQTVLVTGTSVVFGTIGGIVGMALIDWRFAVIATLVLPIAALLVWRTDPVSARRARDVQTAKSELSATLGESFSALEAIQLSQSERLQARRALRLDRVVIQKELAFIKGHAALWGGIEGLTGIAVAAILTTGALGVASGQLSIGSLLAFYLYMQQLVFTVSMGAIAGNTAQKALAGARRAAATLQSVPPRETGLRIVTPKTHGHKLEFRSVAFAYDATKPVLDDITFTVRAGEHVAIMGRSGSGRSTLIRLLSRFIDPVSGQILLDGIDLRSYTVRSLRAAITVVPQQPAILHGTAAENIALDGKHHSHTSIVDAAKSAGLDPDLSEVVNHLDVGWSGGKLSGGQRQRIALARAFLSTARLVVVDEPTSWVDESTEGRIWRSLRSFAKDKTLLAVTHNRDAARAFSRVILIGEGRITFDGPPAALPDELDHDNPEIILPDPLLNAKLH